MVRYFQFQHRSSWMFNARSPAGTLTLTLDFFNLGKRVLVYQLEIAQHFPPPIKASQLQPEAA